MAEPDEMMLTLRRKAMHYADLYNMSRQDRLDLAEMLLRRDITSWSQLTEPQLRRVLDALEGYGLITHLRDG